MDNKKRRSSLRKSMAVDMGPNDMKAQLKRRISFSGKNSVRVFHGEEEPKTWNNSYEISDHLNANETPSNLCVPFKPASLKSALKNTDNKENVDKNLSVNNNASILSTTKDLINISYQHQSSKIYQIENSVDITLYEKELRFQVNEDKSSEQTKSKLCSFSLEDNEKETKSILLGERTMDFMRSLENDVSHMVDDTRNPPDFAKEVTVFSEYMEEEQYVKVLNVKEKTQKEPITIYMSDSLSLTDKEHISGNKRKTQHDSSMQLSPSRAQLINKENIPVPIQSANETQNYSCQMEIEDDIFSDPQTVKVNVDNESVDFQEKLNQISFLHESDDMKINPESNVKSRQTINYNEAIETSPKTLKINCDKPRFRPTINFNQSIDMSPIRANIISAATAQNKNLRTTINFNNPVDISPSRDKKITTLPLQNKTSRATINFNQPIDISPSGDNKTLTVPIQNKSSRTTINFNKSIDFSPENGKQNVCLNAIKSRATTHFNQSIDIDSQSTATNNPAQHGAIPKNKARSTVNYNHSVQTSPKSYLERQTLILKEDICESPKLSQEPARSKNLNVPDSIRKRGQVPKLVVRKICTPLTNKNKNPINLDQQRMLRYKKKQENGDVDRAKEAPTVVETEKLTKADKSLNFSLTSVKNASLSPESLSPLIPSEFRAYNLKQLNDEIERGKINVFSNAPKTPSTDRKFRLAASKNVQSPQSTSIKQRRTLVFDDVDIPISTDTLKNPKSNNYFDFNTTQDDQQQDKKYNTKCRFSQADDIMLDNTSFLTRAKLGDETVSRNSSKREFTHLNDIMDVFDESLREAASKLDKGITGSSVKSTKSCNTKNDTLSSMFQNAKPIFTQNITTFKQMNLCDAMDLSHENHEMEIDNGQEENIKIQKIVKPVRQTIYLNSDIEEQHPPKAHRDLEQTLCLHNKETISDVVSIYGKQASHLNIDIQVLNKLEKNSGLETKKNLLTNDSKIIYEDFNLSTNTIAEHFEKHKEQQSIILDRDTDHNMSIEKPVMDIRKTPTELKEKAQCEKNIFKDGSENPTRKTLFLDEEIPIEKPLTETESKRETECLDISISNRNSTRKTLYFNNEVPLDETQCMNKKDKSMEKDETKTKHLNNMRKTMFFNSEIPLEEIAMENLPEEIENYNAKRKANRKTTILNNEDVEMSNQSGKHVVDNKTPCFNKEIEEENVSHKSDNIQNNNESDRATRRTLYFNSEIDTEKAEIGEIKNVNPNNIKNSNVSRKTLYFNNDIPAERAPVETEVQKDDQCKNSYLTMNMIHTEYTSKNMENGIQKDKSNVSLENVNPSEKQQFSCNEICDLEESKDVSINFNLSKEIPTTRKSVYVAEEMDVTLNETTSANVENNEQLPTMEVSYNRKKDLNKLHSNTFNASKSRKSIYTTECMDLTLDANDMGKEEERVIENVCQKLNNDSMMNLSTPDKHNLENDEECKNLSKCENNKLCPETRKKFSNDNNDDSFTSAKNDKFSFGKPINAAKMTLSRHISTNALANKSKLTNKDENTLMTPKKFTGVNSNAWFYTATPNQSLLDFTKDEKISSEEVRQENNKYLSPLRNDNTNKRLPVNITPVLSIPKKRHTFDDSHMDESNISVQADYKLKNDFSCDENRIQAEEVRKQEPFQLSKGGINDHVMDISGIVANNSILLTPTKQRKSRIPIPISSGKKSNRSLSLRQSIDVHYKEDGDHMNMEIDDQLNQDADILTESIQVMRKATTFLQRMDTEIGVKELGEETEVDPVKKTSIFEGNPITISDVTVFFEAQRKSSSPEAEVNLALDKINMSGLNDIERAKKSLENRYLNLSLEDIDKTRLSLVRISYEDGTINNTNTSVQELVDDCVENQEVPVDKNTTNLPENNVDWKNRRHSINYLRNSSTVCRKCKRCQDTFLNETSSSTSESFILPPLPPLPDLGLERLRRLRKRPSITDVNVLWQRVSLDRTIINALNISDDDSQIISDFYDETDDEFSPAIKCIRKYEKEMLSFEMELLAKHQFKASAVQLPFVLRLGDLLSKNSPNWNFDFQMQLRGKLLFTHKAMYTFAVSLTIEDIDPFGCDISLKSVSLEKGIVPQKNWKPIDFVLDFQFKLNLPFDLQSLCECSNETGILKMLQTIDRVCLNTIKMVKDMQRICFINQASIIRDEFRTYVRKIIRTIKNKTNSDFKYVEKNEVKIELLNLRKLSFRNIASPPLYNFYEEIHLLPTGLEFLKEFLEKPLNYMKHH